MIFRKYIIRNVDWTTEDIADMKNLVQNPYFKTMWKLLDRRKDERKEEIVNGKGGRDRLDELTDLIYELTNYADPQRAKDQ
jgi:hypothetical protein